MGLADLGCLRLRVNPYSYLILIKFALDWVNLTQRE